MIYFSVFDALRLLIFFYDLWKNHGVLPGSSGQIIITKANHPSQPLMCWGSEISLIRIRQWPTPTFKRKRRDKWVEISNLSILSPFLFGGWLLATHFDTYLPKDTRRIDFCFRNLFMRAVLHLPKEIRLLKFDEVLKNGKSATPAYSVISLELNFH